MARYRRNPQTAGRIIDGQPLVDDTRFAAIAAHLAEFGPRD